MIDDDYLRTRIKNVIKHHEGIITCPVDLEKAQPHDHSGTNKCICCAMCEYTNVVLRMLLHG